MAQKARLLVSLVIIVMGLAYLVDVATCDETGFFQLSWEAVATEADSSEFKSVGSGSDSLGSSETFFPPKPPLEVSIAFLPLESEEGTNWLSDSLLIPRAPPRVA